ncbi:hypothetical protein I3843_15G135900 [Carya illinoinensis]|nr:hypothetical protein I3843_15G135900 [Carya illinoinensis]
MLTNRTCLHVANYPVGLESRIKDIDMLLQIEMVNETCMIGIFGIGGIGKTTIAKKMYNLIANKFEGSCFLGDVTEKSKQDKGGLIQLQEKILHDILRDPNVEVGHVDQGINLIQEKLCCKKILLVLDNVDHLDQLEKLCGRCDWFGLGSRIIITTRDEHLLVQHDVVNWKYPMNKLDPREALKLFSWHAFKCDKPDNGFVKLTKLALQYAGGLPLALIVVGSNLRGRDICFWESELKKYKRIPNKKIYDTLKISFDELEDCDQNIFLDIACFFKGAKRKYVTKILDDCGFFPDVGIINLIDKSLITVNECDELTMHDLLEDMGKEIVRQESPEEPGKRSRLWFYEDVREVLEESTNLIDIDLSYCEYLTKISDLSSCSNLEKLILDECKSLVEVHDSVGFLDKLVELRFKQCSRLKNLPRSFKLRSLKVLKLEGCKSLEYFPEIECEMEYLKHLWLEGVVIQELPSSITYLTRLEYLYLRRCKSLQNEISSSMKFLTLSPPESNFKLHLSGSGIVSLPPSIEGFVGLSHLYLTNCKQLEEILHLPPNIEEVHADGCLSLKDLKNLPSSFKLRSLELLDLKGCKSLEKFPEIECEMKHLKYVEMESTIIQELTSSITYLTGLRVLRFRMCTSLVRLPINIFQMKHLYCVDVIYCQKFVNFGKEVGHNGQSMSCTQQNEISSSMEFLTLPPPESNFSLRKLSLSGSGIVSLPPFIKGFVKLSELYLGSCEQLEEILHLPPNIKVLEAQRCVLLECFPHVSTESSFGNDAPNPLLLQVYMSHLICFYFVYMPYLIACICYLTYTWFNRNAFRRKNQVRLYIQEVGFQSGSSIARRLLHLVILLK